MHCLVLSQARRGLLRPQRFLMIKNQVNLRCFATQKPTERSKRLPEFEVEEVEVKYYEQKMAGAAAFAVVWVCFAVGVYLYGLQPRVPLGVKDAHESALEAVKNNDLRLAIEYTIKNHNQLFTIPDELDYHRREASLRGFHFLADLYKKNGDFADAEHTLLRALDFSRKQPNSDKKRQWTSLFSQTLANLILQTHPNSETHSKQAMSHLQNSILCFISEADLDTFHTMANTGRHLVVAGMSQEELAIASTVRKFAHELSTALESLCTVCTYLGKHRIAQKYGNLQGFVREMLTVQDDEGKLSETETLELRLEKLWEA